MPELLFHVPEGEILNPKVQRVLLAGYSGRKQEDVATHIAEMAKLGVSAPSSYPVFYNAMTCLLTQGSELQVVGLDTRPEVEFVLFAYQEALYVTVGNDQFDLIVESRLSAEKSKNLCQKIVAASAWPLDEVHDHWDLLHLELRAGGKVIQAASVKSLLDPKVLLEHARRECGFEPATGMLFSGTIPTIDSLDPNERDFSIAIQDRALGREIRCDFRLVDIAAPAYSNAISQTSKKPI